MRYFFVLLLMLLALDACRKASPVAEYPAQVGDIAFDPKQDDPGFKVCAENQILQYYNFGKGLQYVGEKPKIDEHFRARYLPGTTNDTGYLTIRFVVNCEGKTDRYRIQGMDDNYQEKKFDESVSAQLLQLTRQLDGWKVGEMGGRAFDYYQYLTFRIEQGRLIEITP